MRSLRHGSADESVHISAIRYEGTSSGELKLKYKLLPEAIAGRIQTLRSEGNVVQRLVYVKDAMQLFRRSPVVGLGMGAFENGIYNVQSYHYETKYVHNHYVQTMVDTGSRISLAELIRAVIPGRSCPSAGPK